MQVAMDSSEICFAPVDIVMVVELLTFDSTINLDHLARVTLNAHFLKKRFAASIVRCPFGVALYYSSGLVLINYNSLSKRKQLLELYTNILHRIQPSTKLMHTQVITMTATSSVIGRKLYLNKIQANDSADVPRHPSIKRPKLGSTTQPEINFVPSLFPGLSRSIILPTNPKIKAVFFNSGRFTITGAKSVAEVNEAFEQVKAFLPAFLQPKSCSSEPKKEEHAR